jgi:apolipoprotein D and lipocalin family protein
MKLHKLQTVLTMLFSFVFAGCTGIPKGVKPVTGFDAQRYLGTWHEIARMDHSFERGLTQITANYSMREDGGIKVLNKGYSEELKKWKEAEGKAFFVGEKTTGHLKVAFFGPFYGSYIIADLDQTNYNYALVSGPDHSYLWILARTPTLPEPVLNQLLQKATDCGFATNKLIFPK